MEKDLLQQNQWRFIDESSAGLHVRALHSFAEDDTLCESVGAGQSPASARAWIHGPTVVIGIQDGRLPHLEEGTAFLRSQGYDVIVRNSGGLAVVLDEGIFNVTLVFPEKGRKIGIDSGYEAMWRLVKEMFHDIPKEIRAGEIVGSYCPGSYDLSIEGKKFAGISQRRIRNGVAVQIYMDVHGDAGARAELVRGFYQLARGSTETKFIYPTVNPEVMASLSALFGKPLAAEDVLLRLLQALKRYAGELVAYPLNEKERLLYTAYLERIEERNAKLSLL